MITITVINWFLVNRRWGISLKLCWCGRLSPPPPLQRAPPAAPSRTPAAQSQTQTCTWRTSTSAAPPPPLPPPQSPPGPSRPAGRQRAPLPPAAHVAKPRRSATLTKWTPAEGLFTEQAGSHWGWLAGTGSLTAVRSFVCLFGLLFVWVVVCLSCCLFC